MSNVSVSVDDVDTSADVVEIPEKAVTVNGEPSKDGATMVVKRDDKWWITSGGG